MTTDKIHFMQEKETNLITLYSRAVQSQWPNPILPDLWAEDAIRHIDYDFSKVKGGEIGYMIVAITGGVFQAAIRGARACSGDRACPRSTEDESPASLPVLAHQW